MSRSTQLRQVEQNVYVYQCDRCGREMAPTRKFGESSPGEGASISAREYQTEASAKWLPLRPCDPEDRYEVHAAANVDLCPSCLASLLVWFVTLPPDERSGE